MLGRLFDSPVHLLIIIVLLVIVLSWKRLPDMARSLGRSSRILKSEIDEMKTESKSKASTETVPGETARRTGDVTLDKTATTDASEGATRADSRRDV